MANIVIDGIHLEVNEGDYILEIARANGIFIPAICYLSKCSPTLACKLCMVEINGKRSYACNAKAKDGMNILTNTSEIVLERRAIMQSYVVNHPLECGVCDKSGECELQDFTHLYEIDSQNFFITPSLKKMDSWSQVKYDPSLCILCERCVTTCKDNLGEANLKVIKQDLPQLDSVYWKEKMPKDAFSVWNRAQKGVIGFVGENKCYDCAECASVCPVGALGIKSFQYSTNAWELHKVSSTCNLCPSGCKIVYESKVDMHGVYKIYRVSNDFNFNPICSAGRFGYDIYATSNALDEAINAIKKADCIVVGGNTTNNEARFLSLIKDKFNIKLVNPTLKKYSDFMNVFFSCNASLSTLENISNHKVILSLGSAIKYENPLLRYKINNTLKMQKDSALIYAHPLKDKLISGLSKNVSLFYYAPNSEDVALLAILQALDSANDILATLQTTTIQIESTKEQIEQVIEKVIAENGEEQEVCKEQKKQVKILEDKKYYSAFIDAGIPYESYLMLEQILRKDKPLIVIGDDVYHNANALFMAKILGILQNMGKIDVLTIPPSANANGILQYLTLDSVDSSGFCVGFRTKGDFSIDSIESDCSVPYFNALNDSIINMDYRILPLNAFNPTDKCDYLEYMSDALGIAFEALDLYLPNDFNNNGNDERGIKITPKWQHKIADIPYTIINVNTQNAYLRDLSAHFYPYTRFSKQFQSNIGIYVSSQKLENLRNEFAINEGDEITLCGNDCEISARIYIDSDMDDDFFAISPQIRGACRLFGDSKYTEVRIIK